MKTECNKVDFEFEALGQRAVVAKFDGGDITSDAGALLLKAVEARTGIIRDLAGCFTDYRKADQIEHTVEQLVAQRVYALCLGYEDLNDHDDLRQDPLLAVLADKTDPKGEHRRRAEDRGKALAGKSTLNRLELTPAEATAEARYKKIVMQEAAIDRLLVDKFLAAHERAPERIVIDLDATDDPLYGNQEGRFFHGYYREYCYLPLYTFCGEFLLGARLQSADIDPAAGVVEEVARIIAQIRAVWPQVAITLRGDAGFCREEIIAWCEAQGIDYVFGLAKNERLLAEIEAELQQAQKSFEETLQAARVFKDLTYQTLKSWSCMRRVVAKAEYLEKGGNPRFVVTSLAVETMAARALYEDLYCERGDMENRIKEQQLGLFADRTSTATMRANQLRLYFSSVAYLLMHALRRLGLAGTELAKAQCTTIRLKVLKIGAQIRVTVRKVWVSMASSYPYAEIFRQVYGNLQRLAVRSG